MSTKKQMPPPIKPLEGEAKVFYDKVCGYLEEMDLVFVVDAMMVFQAAVWWMIYIDSVQEILDGKEQLMVYETGHSTIHPRVTKMKMATEKVLQLFRQLGIGEEARQRLKLMAQKEAKDPLDEI